MTASIELEKQLSELKKQLSVAIVCFIPDFGHLQPLLKIADALAESGVQIKCYIADECAPLMSRFQFSFATLEDSSRLKRNKELERLFSRGIFFNSVCLYIHYLLMYPKVSEAAGRAAHKLKRQLFEQRPDVIICDALWFVDWYARIAASLEVPLVVNSLDGSLAYNQRYFVRTFGVTTVSPIIQAIVEIVAAMSKKACNFFYRFCYFRQWMNLRAVRRAAGRQFEAAFPVPPKTKAKAEWIVLGTAVVERKRLKGLIRQANASRREFPPLRFRSYVPMTEQLREWIDSDEENSIVYVSFGSAVELDTAFAKAVYEGLRNVPARIIWSLPANQQVLLADLPLAENIRLESFVPQAEVLNVRTVRCFITQGGPHSVQEALFGGTPMLCIPFFVDQAYNSSVVARLGVGKRLWRREVSPQSISSAVKDILKNGTYLKNTQELRDELIRNEGGTAVTQYLTELVRSWRERADSRNVHASGKSL